MKQFFVSQARLLGVLCALCCALQISARADAEAKKIPLVTRDNFVSLKLTTAGDAQMASSFVVAGNTISRARTRILGTASPENTAPLSNNQLVALLNAFNRAGFSGIEGNQAAIAFSPPTVRLRQTMTIVLSDENNRDRSFTIAQFGAPGFDEFAAALRRLSADKFSDPTSEDAVTRQNFQSVQLKTFGGFAGMQSSITISLEPSANNTKPKLVWEQTIGGRKANRVRFPSDADFNHLISMLNAAKIAQLNGKKFEQAGLYDGFHETLTVILKNGRKFVVENYGNTAPAEYYAVMRQLKVMNDGTAAIK